MTTSTLPLRRSSYAVRGPGLAALVGDPAGFTAGPWTHETTRLALQVPVEEIYSMTRLVGLLTQPLLRLPHVRIVDQGLAVAEATYTEVRQVGHGTVTDAVRPERVLDYFSRGATVVIDALDQVDAGIGAWCAALADDLGHPVDASAFLTPPGSQGLAVHIDDEDVFCLQISGAKTWTVHRQLRPVPTEPRPLGRQHPGPQALTGELSVGEGLYLPRAAPHWAAAGGTHSLHVSFAVRRPTALSLARDTLERAASTVASLDVAAGDVPASKARHLLDVALDAPVGPRPIPSERHTPELGRVLTDLEVLSTKRSATSRPVALQCAVPLRLEPGTGSEPVLADFAGLKVRFPSERLAVLRRLAAGHAVSVADLTDAGPDDVAPLVARGVLTTVVDR